MKASVDAGRRLGGRDRRRRGPLRGLPSAVCAAVFLALRRPRGPRSAFQELGLPLRRQAFLAFLPQRLFQEPELFSLQLQAPLLIGQVFHAPLAQAQYPSRGSQDEQDEEEDDDGTGHHRKEEKKVHH